MDCVASDHINHSLPYHLWTWYTPLPLSNSSCVFCTKISLMACYRPVYFSGTMISVVVAFE
jgi:hypothetical protein